METPKSLFFYTDVNRSEKAEKLCKEELDKNMAQIFIISLQENQELKEYYEQNKIKRGKFIEITKKEDFDKIPEADMVYFLSTKDVSEEIKEQISKLGESWCVKVAVSPEKLINLTTVCPTWMKSDLDYKKTHRFLKEIIECIAVPSMVCLDYADIKELFTISSRMELRKYKTELSEKDKIVEEIKREFKEIDSCFFVVSGGTDLTLSDVMSFEDQMGSIVKYIVYGARIEEHLKGKVELSLYAGWTK